VPEETPSKQVGMDPCRPDWLLVSQQMPYVFQNGSPILCVQTLYPQSTFFFGMTYWRLSYLGSYGVEGCAFPNEGNKYAFQLLDRRAWEDEKSGPINLNKEYHCFDELQPSSIGERWWWCPRCVVPYVRIRRLYA
jgi:hypothetical protein